MLLWWWLAQWLSLSCLAVGSLALLQVVTDVQYPSVYSPSAGSVSLTASTTLDRSWIMSIWKWLDVLLRMIPVVQRVYRSSYHSFYSLWICFVVRQRSCVTMIEAYPIPYDPQQNQDQIGNLNQHQIGNLNQQQIGNLNQAQIGNLNQDQIVNLRSAWRTESRVQWRALSGRWERCWSFVPSRDYLIRYAIKNSWLQHPFFVVYRKDQPCIFPPEPLTTYWEPSRQSPIESLIWAGTRAPVNARISDIVKELAGPTQCLDSTGWRVWKELFPAVFTKPAAASEAFCGRKEEQKEVEPAEMTAAERRRFHRLRQIADPAKENHAIILTRANQSIAAIPTDQ